LKPLILSSAILIGLSGSADARDVLLLCRGEGGPSVGFNIKVDLENSALTKYEPGGRSHYVATITPEYIEYPHGMIMTRINRNSGDWVAWSYTGTMMGKGSCQKTDDMRRLESLCCYPKPRE
jgi:hypothetical protein